MFSRFCAENCGTAQTVVGIPRFEAWNKRDDAFQIAEPFVFGGDTIVNL